MRKLENKKISQKILRLIKPYMKVVERSNTEQRLNSLLAIGSTAWNIDVTGKEDLKNAVLQLIKNKIELSEMEKIIDKLVQRKKRLFPDDDRYIVDCKINSTKKNKYDVTVSFLYKDEYEKSLK